MIPADLYAFAAQDTAVRIVVQVRMAVVHLRLLQPTLEASGFQTHLQKPGNILQDAVAVGRTISTIHAVDRKQQLQCTFL
jgi:hypothetical protein